MWFGRLFAAAVCAYNFRHKYFSEKMFSKIARTPQSGGGEGSRPEETPFRARPQEVAYPNRRAVASSAHETDAFLSGARCCIRLCGGRPSR